MKTKTVLVLCVMSLFLFSFVNIKQDVTTAIANYEGFEYDMYSFNIPSKVENKADVIIAFGDIPDDILKEFDLKSDKLVGIDFEITYKVVFSTEDAGEGEEPEETYVLKSLKRVKKK